MVSVLHISTFDILPGAARAAYRLHRQLLAVGVSSHMVVSWKEGDDSTVLGLDSISGKASAKIRSLLCDLPLRFYSDNGNRSRFSINWVGDTQRICNASRRVDIVHLHWIGAGFLSPRTIGKIKKPVVWRLPDMWAFTGGCHYSGGCNKYEDKCGKCPSLNSHSEFDLTRIQWKAKKYYFKNKHLTIVAPSKWLANAAKKSSLFHDQNVIHIPTGVDPSLFKPIDKFTARSILGIPYHSKIILLGSIGRSTEHRKGVQYSKGAFEKLAAINGSNSIQLVIIGSPQQDLDEISARFTVRYLGHLKDDLSLAVCYNAADVFVTSAIEDNLSNMILESLSCGTPVVAFNIGGMPDAIEHKCNGYLAVPYDSDDLAHGIAWVLAHQGRYPDLSKRAREKVEQEFTLMVQAKRYRDLYEEILRNVAT